MLAGFGALGSGWSYMIVPKELTFRPMADSDIAQVMVIEMAGHAYPWTEGILHDCLRTGYRCQVAEYAGEIVAFSVIQIAAGEAHVFNVCVNKVQQRQGLGAAVLKELLDAAERAQVRSIFLEVRPSNEAAVRLYERFGFMEVGVRKQYYPSPQGREDALIFAKELFPSLDNS